MQLVWKGKLTKNKGFPVVEISNDAKIFLGEDNSWYSSAPIIPIILLGIIVFKFKKNYIPGLRMDSSGLWIGMALAVLLLIVHELIHGFSCPKDCTVNYYYSVYGITCYPLCSLKRNRYIFMAMTPALFLGLIPMIIWIFIPVKFAMLNSTIFAFSWISLSVSTADIYNLLKALVKVPKESLIQASGTKVYWFLES